MGIELLLTVMATSAGATWAILDRIHSSEKHLDHRLDLLEQRVIQTSGDLHAQELRIKTLEDYNKKEIQQLKQAIAKLETILSGA